MNKDQLTEKRKALEMLRKQKADEAQRNLNAGRQQLTALRDLVNKQWEDAKAEDQRLAGQIEAYAEMEKELEVLTPELSPNGAENH